MEDETSNADRDEPPAGRPGAHDLARLAKQQQEATWGETGAARGAVPGVLSGDVGPKGRVSAQLRSLSREQRGAGSVVPRGTTSGTGGGTLLAAMLLVAVAIFALAGLVAWALLR